MNELSCSKCDEKIENWLCLYCGESNCSRYVNKHSLAHLETFPDHCIVISIMDLSIWCYKCHSYIEDKVSYNSKIQVLLDPYEKSLSDVKFGKNFVPTLDNLEKVVDWKIDDKKISNVKYFNFVELFKEKKCKILFK